MVTRASNGEQKSFPMVAKSVVTICERKSSLVTRVERKSSLVKWVGMGYEMVGLHFVVEKKTKCSLHFVLLT